MKKKIRPRIGGWLYFPLQNAIWSGAGSELPRRKKGRCTHRPCVCLMSRTSWFSITTDNGTEFTHFKSIERVLKIPVFFAKPSCSADKPHIENINGLIRQYIPKGKSFDEISDDEIRQIQNQLNNRPRKKLGYKTPYEVFSLHLWLCCTWHWKVPRQERVA